MLNREEHLAVLARAERDQLLAGPDRGPETLLRLAEIADILEGDEGARPYWEAAAATGSQDAIDMLNILDEEREPGGDAVILMRRAMMSEYLGCGGTADRYKAAEAAAEVALADAVNRILDEGQSSGQP